MVLQKAQFEIVLSYVRQVVLGVPGTMVDFQNGDLNIKFLNNLKFTSVVQKTPQEVFLHFSSPRGFYADVGKAEILWGPSSGMACVS